MEINLKTLYIAIYTKQHNISKYIYRKIHNIKKDDKEHIIELAMKWCKRTIKII